MFSNVYVLLPFSDQPPAEAIRAVDRFVRDLERHPATGGYGRG
jgi:hypothetical protein